MTDVEVHIDLEGQVRRLGLLRRQMSRRSETVTFESAFEHEDLQVALRL